MISRRFLIGGAALAALSSPNILRAHTAEPFVLADEFQPREVRVREQHAPGQILVFPRSFFCTTSSIPSGRSATESVSARPGLPSGGPRSSSARPNGRPGVRRTT